MAKVSNMQAPGSYVKTARGTIIRLFQGRGYIVSRGENDSAPAYFLALIAAAYTPDEFSLNPIGFKSVLAAPDKDANAARNLLPKLEQGSRILYKTKKLVNRKNVQN